MKAFAVDAFGEEGSVQELPTPEPGEGQVRVRVEAASVNPVDNSILGGAYKDYMPHHYPLIPGMDLGGVVDALGPGVSGFAVGDAVFGNHGKMSVGEGTFAEYTVASAGTIAHRPPSIDAPFGSALSLAGVSALEMVDAAAPQAGDVVVVLGAAGGIGSIAVQLLVEAGATVVAVATSLNHPYLTDLGAAETIDYRRQDVVEAIRTAHPEGVAALLDMVGDKDRVTAVAALVRSGGHVVSMMRAADVEVLAARGITGVNIGTQVTTEKLARLADAVTAGTIRRPNITTVPLDQAGAALAECATRHVRGKLVVIP